MKTHGSKTSSHRFYISNDNTLKKKPASLNIKFMDKKNTSLRTNNTILNRLNETYYVTKPYALHQEKKDSGQNNTYLAYETPIGGGLKFVFSVEKKLNAKTTVYFNKKRYSDVELLMKAVKEYNETLPYPSYTYDPYLNRDYVMGERIKWYLTEVLGYRRTNDTNTLTLIGGFEMPLSTILYEIKRGKKYLSKKTGYDGGYACIEFDDEDDAILKINTISITEVSCGFEKLQKLLESIRGGFGNLDGSKILTMDGIFKGDAISFKEKVIENLENVLKNLKGKTV